MVLSLTQDKKNNYKDLQMLSKDLKNQNIDIHNDIESVFRETEHLRNTIVNSQVYLFVICKKFKHKIYFYLSIEWKRYGYKQS